MPTIAPSARPRVALPGSADEAEAIARDAYIYLYPLVLMEVTRRQFLDAGPANRFSHLRSFPTAHPGAVVRPSLDTLYSAAWLDLTQGPVVVSTADTGGRSLLIPMIDMWTDVFAVPGSRSIGTGAAELAVVPPRWCGSLPAGAVRIDASTPHVWVLGRTRTGGERDHDALRRVRDGYRVTTLSGQVREPERVEEEIGPPVDPRTEPRRQVAELPALDFFELGAALMKVNRPHPTDWSVIGRMRRVGLAPGRGVPSGVTASLEMGAAAGLKRIREKVPAIARVTSGWQMSTDMVGTHGDFYLRRAATAMAGLGADQPDDAIFRLGTADADGRPVLAGNRYVLHFDRSELPPVGAFWSLRMYDADGGRVANPLGRFAIGDRDALAFNPDGSLDLWIQRECPGRGREPNWLPAPESGTLGLTMRLYAPGAPEAAGRWNPPPVRLVR